MIEPVGDFLDPRVEGRFVIRTDPHCHILPGLDDGSPNLDMSLRMARRMAAVGIQNVIATPHGIHPGIETNVDPEFLRDQVALLNEALRQMPFQSRFTREQKSFCAAVSAISLIPEN